jgi:tetratricopeptide (TPR) repeat protein
VAVLSFVLVFAPSSLYQRLATLGDPGADDSVQFRVQLWKDSAGLFGRSPGVGTGLGTYAAAIPPHRSGPDETRAEYAESDWVQLACEGGAAALSVAVLFLLAIARGAHHLILEERSESSRGVRQGALAAVAALVVHGLVDFNFRIPSNALLFAVLLGVVAPAGRKLSWERRRIGHWALAAIAVAASVAAASYVLKLGTSEDLNRKVNPLLAAPEEFPDLIQRLAASRERVPQNPETSFLLGRLYNEEAYRSREEQRYRELRLDQARAAFRTSLARAPSRGRTWFELAWTEASLRNDERADRLFARALVLEPHWANLRANYALYLVSRGRIDEALAQVEAGRELEPGLSSLDALNVIGPYLGDDPVSLRRAAGDDEEGASAIASFRKSSERGLP